MRLAEQPRQNNYVEVFNPEIRARADTVTWLAETLNGNMRTSFDFSFDGEEFYGEDNGSLTEVFDSAIQDAEIIIRENPNLLFELRRRLIERGELEDMKAMARGELTTDDGEQVNTIVTVSDFPPELMDEGDDVGGYNRSRKQTMLRVITLEEDGSLKVTTQSLDRSNRKALEAIFSSVGKEAEPGELLEQRINLSLPSKWRHSVVNNLTAVYDQSLIEQFGGDWYAGRRPADDRNTFDFVIAQHDLIDWHTSLKLNDPESASQQRYNLAATLKARYDRFIKGASINQQEVSKEFSIRPLLTNGAIFNSLNLIRELYREGSRAASRGEVFSGCGASVSANSELDEISLGDQLDQLGWGNKSKASSKDDDCEYISKSCPECGEKNVKTTVRSKTIDGKKVKHISGDCGCSKIV